MPRKGLVQHSCLYVTPYIILVCSEVEAAVPPAPLLLLLLLLPPSPASLASWREARTELQKSTRISWNFEKKTNLKVTHIKV